MAAFTCPMPPSTIKRSGSWAFSSLCLLYLLYTASWIDWKSLISFSPSVFMEKCLYSLLEGFPSRNTISEATVYFPESWAISKPSISNGRVSIFVISFSLSRAGVLSTLFSLFSTSLEAFSPANLSILKCFPSLGISTERGFPSSSLKNLDNKSASISWET